MTESVLNNHKFNKSNQKEIGELGEKDKIFFDSLLNYERFYNLVQQESQRFIIDLKEEHVSNPISDIEINEKKYQFLPIGFLKNKTFNWMFEENQLQLEHFILYKILKKYVSVEGLDYLFSTQVKLCEKYLYIIPYLLSITNPAFNVIEFETLIEDKNDENTDTVILFGLIDLEIEDEFDFRRDFLTVIGDENRNLSNSRL